MGFLWIITLSLCTILIVSSQDPVSTGAGYAPSGIDQQLWPSIAGAAIVFLYYYLRFSEWPVDAPTDLRKRPPRSYTTKGRYRLSAAIYGTAMAAVFLGLYLFPEALAQLLSQFSGAFDSATAYGQSLASGYQGQLTVGGPADPQSGVADSAAVPLALFLDQFGAFLEQGASDENWLFTVIALVVVAWPKLPFSRDDAIRGGLQRFAAIPTEAAGLILRLRWNHTEFAPAPLPQYRLLRSTDLVDADDFSALPEVDAAPARIGAEAPEVRAAMASDAYADAGEPQPGYLDRLARFEAHPQTTENPQRIGYLFAKLLYLTDRFISDGSEGIDWLTDRQQLDASDELVGPVDEISVLLRDLRSEAIDLAKRAKPDAFEALMAQLCKDKGPGRQPPVQKLLDFVDRELPHQDSDVRILQQMRLEVKQKIHAVLDRLYFRIVTSTLAAEPTRERQRLRFERMGFRMASTQEPLQESDALATLVILVLLAVFLPTAIYWWVSGNLEGNVLDMRCDDMVLDKPYEAALWSVVAVTQNALAVISAFVLNAMIDRRNQVPATICVAAAPELDFRTVTRRFVAFLNAASLAFGVNLLLLAALTRLFPGVGCSIGQLWTWAILPGIAGGFTALYLRMHARHCETYQWPLWQAFLTGLAGVGIGMYVLDTQSGAGAQGIDLDWPPLIGAAAGVIVGLLFRFHYWQRPVQRRMLWWTLIPLLLVTAPFAIDVLIFQSEMPQLKTLLTEASEWLGHQPAVANLLVVALGFLLSYTATGLLTLGYRIFLPECRHHDADAQQQHEQAASGSATMPQSDEQPPVLWSAGAIVISVCYGAAVFPLAVFLLGLDASSTSQPETKTAYAELAFLLYAYAAAASVALLSGFFVLKFRESGMVCGQGLAAFMNDDSFEALLEDKDSNALGRIGVIPLHPWKAMVINVPHGFHNLKDVFVRLPNGERRPVYFWESSSATPGDATTDAADVSGIDANRRIWMELEN